MRKDNLRKYLASYAESEATGIAAAMKKAGGRWQDVLTVPLMGEFELLPQFLDYAQRAAASSQSVLIILLINSRLNADALTVESNAQALEWLREKFGMDDLWDAPPCRFASLGKHGLLVIDRSRSESCRFPDDQGVGLARKILGDVALALQDAGVISSPWVHCSDADVLLSPDYFSAAHTYSADGRVAALVMPFAHVPAEGYEEAPSWPALMQYEMWLRYYVLGLQAAGSPYGYPAIGSMITFHRTAYALGRGFPKRLAGEDFYLLNKLAKLGTIACPVAPQVRIMDRPSTRVPFGTGVGTQKILDTKAAGEEYSIYDPRVFQLLHALLSNVSRHLENFGKPEARHDLAQEVKGILDANKAWEFIERFDIAKGIAGARQRGRSRPEQEREFHFWFDAFRTLRFVHEARDNLFPNLPLISAFKKASFLAPLPEDLSLESLLQHLRSLPFTGTQFPSREK